MYRRIPFAAAIVTAASLLAPTAAMADPSISIAVDGAPLVDEATGMRGQTVSIVGNGCAIGSPNDPAHLGMFGSAGQDPMVDPSAMHLAEIDVDELGGFTWETVLPADHELGTFTVRWYCSPQNATSLADQGIEWVSPTYTLTVVDEGAPNARTAGRSAVTAGAGGLVVLTDPDELPAVDRMGITGDEAAVLKQRTDERAARIGRVLRMYEVFFGRVPDPAGFDYWTRRVGTTMTAGQAAAKMASSSEFTRGYARLSDRDFVDQLYRSTLGRPADDAGRDFWVDQLGAGRRSRAEVGLAFADSAEFTRRTANLTYVAAAHQETTGRIPSLAVMQPAVEQLDRGAFKVQVVEDIALRSHDAAWWNARL